MPPKKFYFKFTDVRNSVEIVSQEFDKESADKFYSFLSNVLTESNNFIGFNDLDGDLNILSKYRLERMYIKIIEE